MQGLCHSRFITSIGSRWAFVPVAFSLYTHCRDIYPTQRNNGENTPVAPAEHHHHLQVTLPSSNSNVSHALAFCVPALMTGISFPPWHWCNELDSSSLWRWANIYFMFDEPRYDLICQWTLFISLNTKSSSLLFLIEMPTKETFQAA